MTRGDALALAVSEFIAGVSIKALHYDGRLDQLDTLKAALATHRASEPTGERVRLAIWLNRKGTIMGCSADTDGTEHSCSPPSFYIEFTLPPRTTPPTVDAEVCE